MLKNYQITAIHESIKQSQNRTTTCTGAPITKENSRKSRSETSSKRSRLFRIANRLQPSAGKDGQGRASSIHRRKKTSDPIKHTRLFRISYRLQPGHRRANGAVSGTVVTSRENLRQRKRTWMEAQAATGHNGSPLPWPWPWP